MDLGSVWLMVQQNWIVVALTVALVLVLALWLASRRRAASRQRYRAPDALDEGAAPAQRNQALIDAPSATAAALAATGPGILGGIGEVLAAAAAQEVRSAEEAREVARAEAAEADATPDEAPAADDLTRIKGLGPKLSTRLRELGVTRFSQIAAWSQADLAAIDAQLGAFAGRPARDLWVEQCRFLASGDVAGYEAKFGKL
jgi:predicted flap endonuclease-1-like 5' DNA nuclease